MSVWGKEPTDYRTRYQVLSGRENLAYYARRRQLIDQGVPLAGGLNMFPPDKDASIITLMKQGAAFTTTEEYDAFLGGPAPEPTPAPTPAPTSEWVAIISGTGNEDSYGLNIDSLNNVYTCGTYDSNPLTIYNINGTQFTTLPSGILNTFIVKYNSSGVGQWATRLENIVYGYAIACDTSNSMIIGGQYNGSLVIYNSDGTIFVSSLPTSGVYIIKYNSSGYAQWAASINGSITFGLLTTDSLNNIYASGYYNDLPITIYNSNGTSFGTLPNSGSSDVFIVKYNPSGNAQWATRIAGVGIDQGYTIACDTLNNIYISGDYTSNPLTIYNSNGASFGTLPNSGSSDAFIVKYDSSGNAQWATRIAGVGIDQGYTIACDTLNNIYISGQYSSNPLTIYNSNGTSFGTLPNSGSSDAFIVKYDSSGNAQWATRIAGVGMDQGYTIACDTLNNIYISGQYSSNPITIYNSNGTSFGTLPNSGNYDIFLVKYDPNGNAQWVTKIGGTGNDTNEYTTISCDSLNNVYVNGNYTSNPLTIYNSDGTVSKTISNSGLKDCFVVKYDSNGFVVKT